MLTGMPVLRRIVTENGYGKRTEIEEYLRLGEDGARHPQQRGGKGLKNYNLTAKTGLVAGVAIVEDGEDVMLVENGGGGSSVAGGVAAKVLDVIVNGY